MNKSILQYDLKKVGPAVRSFNVAVLLAVVSGCSSVDVLTKTENGASYEYELGQFDTIDVVDMAEHHCSKYGKNAELINRYSGADKIFNTLIFNCS